jgi:hypothetical protein
VKTPLNLGWNTCDNWGDHGNFQSDDCGNDGNFQYDNCDNDGNFQYDNCGNGNFQIAKMSLGEMSSSWAAGSAGKGVTKSLPAPSSVPPPLAQSGPAGLGGKWKRFFMCDIIVIDF